MSAPGSHYFDEEPTTESAPKDVTLLLPDTQLVLDRNPNYWRDDRPYLDAVEFRPIVDNVEPIPEW